MLRKILAFILLLNHLNTSMFIPQMSEVDRYDSSGTQIDDVNTLVEFIDQIVLEHNDPTPEDEDDDTEQPYHITKIVDYCWHPYVTEVHTKASSHVEPVKVFTGYIEHKPTSGFPDILLPPPKA